MLVAASRDGYGHICAWQTLGGAGGENRPRNLVDHRSLDHNRIIEATPATDVSTLLQHTMRHHAAHSWSVHSIGTRSGCPIVSCETERVFS